MMAFVATLIANPSNPVLTPALGEAAAKAVNASSLYWLADGIACDIALPSGTDAEAARNAIAGALAGQPIDIVVQEQDKRRKKL
ncbi:MAG: phosphoserine phosphatase SerB, partial [Rhizobium oryzihabitans]